MWVLQKQRKNRLQAGVVGSTAERKKFLSLEAWLMQAWGLRHCPGLAEHLNSGLRMGFTAALVSLSSLCYSASAIYFITLLFFCHSLVPVLMKYQCSQSFLEFVHHRAILENSWLSHCIYTSAANPAPKSLCVHQPAGPPLLSSHAAVPGGSWPSSLKYALLSLGHQSVTWMASSLRQGLHSCFLLSG